jgi:C4-dicarboxylate-specific signal transduction histidine kinase
MTSGLERSMEVLSRLTPASQAGFALAVVAVQFAIVVAAFAWCSRLRLAELLLTEYEERLARLTRVAILGELSGALAHQLLQPLTAILCNTQAAQSLLAKGQCNAAAMEEILQDISSDNKHAGQIIQSLRALFTRGEIQFRPVEIRELVDDVLAIVRGTLIERNIQPETAVADLLPAVYADRIQLQQVLLNLILNACESIAGNARDKRQIAIAAAMEGGQNAVRISIITAHKGRLWAAHEPDRGAAFHFTVPVATREGGQ